jgi:hypothetical protein
VETLQEIVHENWGDFSRLRNQVSGSPCIHCHYFPATRFQNRFATTDMVKENPELGWGI